MTVSAENALSPYRPGSQGTAGLGLSHIPTCDLQAELAARLGVSCFVVPVDTRYGVILDGMSVCTGKGPVTISVNID